MQNDKNRKTAKKGLTEDRGRAIIYNVVRHNSEYVPIAQLDRVTGYEPVGQGFESLQARQGIHKDFGLCGFFLF